MEGFPTGTKFEKTKRICCISSLFFVTFLLLFSGAGYAKPLPFKCSLKPSCNFTEGEKEVLHLSSLKNAHGELPNIGNYPYKVCCKLNDENNDFMVKISSSPCVHGKFLSLSSQTNAHAAEAGVYPWNICLETLDKSQGIITCQLRNSCSGFGTCVVSLSSTKNAHIGACDEYPLKLCCAYITTLINLTTVGFHIKIRITTSKGEPISNKEVKAYLCYAEEKYCDEGAKYLAKMSNVTDENGYMMLTFYANLYPGRRYKIGVVTENGYAETEEFTVK